MKGVVGGRQRKLTLPALVVLESLEGHEGSATGQKLVGELGLVVARLELVVVVLSVVCCVKVRLVRAFENK